MKDRIVHDFTDPGFQEAFKQYFEELGFPLDDWDTLFQYMNDEQKNVAILREAEEEGVIGFIQFRVDSLKHWFFEETIGFVREFWVHPAHRQAGHGASLLKAAEHYFVERNVYKSVLTTDTVPAFYVRQGYVRDASYLAKNENDVYVKLLNQAQP